MNKNISGYILIECMVAMTILTVGLMSVFSLLSRSLSSNRVVANRYQATYLAAEGIELVKGIIEDNAIKDLSWNTYLNEGEFETEFPGDILEPYSGKVIKFDDTTKSFNYEDGKDTPFTRKIILTFLGSGNEIKVESIVDWVSRGSANYKVKLESHFFDWR